MSDIWTLDGDGQRAEGGGFSTTATTQSTITAPGSANTKGAWLELVTSTAFDSSGFLLNTTLTTTASRQILVDIGVGVAGSEQVILSNYAFSLGAMAHSISHYIPLAIPAGTRVSCRYQRNNGATFTASVYPIGMGYWGGAFGSSETWGADTSDSGGTAVTPGTDDTKGSYVQLVAGSTRDVNAIIIHLTGGDFSMAGAHRVLIDLATGAAGSETVIIPNLMAIGNAGDAQYRPHAIGPIPCNIPAGSRVAVRAQDTDTTVEVFDVSISAFSA